MSKFLDEFGLAYFWNKVKTYVDARIEGSGGTGDGANNFVWWSPHMASNTTPAPYIATASSEPFPHHPIWNAFDGNTTTHNNMWFVANYSSNWQWIQLDIGKQILVKGIKMYFPETDAPETIYFPKIFNIQASNDGVNYTTLFESTDGGGYTPEIGVPRECMFNDNAVKYRYYKVNCGLNYNGDYHVYIGDIQFYLNANTLYE